MSEDNNTRKVQYMPKKPRPAATPARVPTAKEELDSAIRMTQYNWNATARELMGMIASMMNSDLSTAYGKVRDALQANNMEPSLLNSLGILQRQGQEIDRLCAVLDQHAKYLELLQAVAQRMDSEQDAARMALEVVAAVIESTNPEDLSLHEQSLEEARATITHGEIEDLLEQRAQAEEDAQLRAEGWQGGDN